MACNIRPDPEVEKAFWNEAKGHLASGLEPEDVIKTIAKTHDLGTDAVGAVLQSKQLFKLTNEAWAKQAKLTELRTLAKREANMSDVHPALKALRTAYDAPRTALTIYHGGAIPFTHSRNLLATPGEIGIFKDISRRSYSYFTKEGGSARWRRDMATMRSDPKFNFWARNGLDIKLQSRPSGMGMGRWTRMSFDAIKPGRLELAKKYWDQLDPADRTQENAQKLAKSVNHSTGTVNTPTVINKIAGATMFAPKLRFAKYAAATDIFHNPFSAKRFAKLAAVNLGLLGINDLFNRHIANSNDNVNWTNPARADWMRMKVAGMTIPMSPLMETLRLPVAAGAVLMNPNEDNKAKVLTKELASAAHPAINALYGAATGTDLATGNALPFKGASQYMYGEHRGEKKTFGKWRTDKYAKQIGKGEYASGFAPIPIQPLLKEFAKEGIPPNLSEKWLRAYMESVLSGGAGTHVYPDVPYKQNP